MQGLMQSWSLTVDKILEHAKTWHGDREVVTRTVEGPIVRTTYAGIYTRAKRVSAALTGYGVRIGDRVATLGFNTARHLETWYGIMGIGAICHTLNPRLGPEQLAWIINHAEDRIVFCDLPFVPLLEAVLPHCPSVERVVVMTDGWHMPSSSLPRADCYEQLMLDCPPDAVWGAFDEETACGLCYTSGTEGAPKGVLYSHRSNYLHTLMIAMPDLMGASCRDVVMPVVPMFHANAWGLAFAAPAVGAKLVMPGAKLDGAALVELLETERCTFSAAVPTLWQGVLEHLRSANIGLSTLKRVVIGGAPCPESMIRIFKEDYGVEVQHAWGMTETSPVGAVNALPANLMQQPFGAQLPTRKKQGRPPLGVELAVFNDKGEALPHDGVSAGVLKARGPAVAKAYFKASGLAVDANGYFDTGDVAHIDARGFVKITDRAKDLIKSGGEWISSQEIEDHVAALPAVDRAAVIGMAHPKWGERPLLLVQLAEGKTTNKAEILNHIAEKLPAWWSPDEVLVTDHIPLGPTGKIDKKVLRARYQSLTQTEGAEL